MWDKLTELKTKKLRKIALKEMPDIDVKIKHGFIRRDVINELNGPNKIGIELGVAKGLFSEYLAKSGKFSLFFGVDEYSDKHDTKEYKSALRRIGILQNYKLLRMKFDEAIDLFDKRFFDFIYLDGYAHSGEEGGATLFEWYSKLKVGGVMAGHDYHEDWPLVMWAVNDFISKVGGTLFLTEEIDEKYPSWFFIKEKDVNISRLGPPNLLLKISSKESKRIKRQQFFKKWYKWINSRIDIYGA